MGRPSAISPEGCTCRASGHDGTIIQKDDILNLIFRLEFNLWCGQTLQPSASSPEVHLKDQSSQSTRARRVGSM